MYNIAQTYFRGTISAADEKRLSEWLRVEANKQQFDEWAAEWRTRAKAEASERTKAAWAKLVESQKSKVESQKQEPKGLELWDSMLQWESASGEKFEATPRLILLGGHWAPGDMPFPYRGKDGERPWHWDEVAKQNPFFAQIWAPLHDATEDNIYGTEIFDGWEK